VRHHTSAGLFEFEGAAQQLRAILETPQTYSFTFPNLAKRARNQPGGSVLRGGEYAFLVKDTVGGSRKVLSDKARNPWYELCATSGYKENIFGARTLIRRSTERHGATDKRADALHR